MGHTIRYKGKLVARVRRIRGQIEAVERALDADAECERVMHLLASARAALAGLTAEVIEDHVRSHLVDQEKHPGALDEADAEQLFEVLRTYMR